MSRPIHLQPRPVDATLAGLLQQQGLSALEARIYAARGIASVSELEHELGRLLPWQPLKNAREMAERLADAIARREKLLIVADYDADGATACAVGLRGLALLGGVVDFIVPNRFEYGYGLTPEIVEQAAQRQPDILITVDNGIASVAGVARAHELGLEVLITDHHLPGDTLPEALIVNPNQPGCAFPSKHLAGVGVMFYVLLALRAVLRERGAFAGTAEPNLACLLDLVALGTVADVVKLDSNNRILVEQGLRRIRAGRAVPGLLSLFAVAGRNPARAGCFDLGFALGPRLNAAGRLDDMSLGIACLLAGSEAAAEPLARELDRMNRARREIETDMREEAEQILAGVNVGAQFAVTLYQPDWHQGVVGIVAARVKDRFHRPTIVFAQASDQEIKGSGRSILGLHLRDALDLVSKRHPGLIQRFGGHAMAAGLSLLPQDFARFAAAFEAVCAELLEGRPPEQVLDTDGELPQEGFHFAQVERLEKQVWGQGFPPPLFTGQFRVVEQRLVGEKHLKLRLATAYGQVFDAMRFSHAEPLPETIAAAYRIGINEFRGERNVQLQIEHCF
ncbi:single-stranded-DNA-specific exonuclease RecJ [Chitinilyticum piscinae]|uniref:Single-stranded-DNA-specific exonuclease RecJ n=1 Tax=Chitinilyticum piscinae TaxID=2866724 RepID=A0A8J7K8L0_9NEIS|nr:single-stranded-DNA-specific exonuclease RecJ [Chitinilyticum piscinae]MBE9609658.1 single-stranded-DNA-specific exonuclease RecJ [Chitinilyticum piscinae]